MNGDYYFDITDDEMTVRTFQEMLRLISSVTKDLPVVAVDGIYGEGMKNAVAEYQKKKGLQQTGTVDTVTWQNVADDYESILKDSSPPMMIDPFPNVYGYSVKEGERSDLVLLIQIMLSSLRIVYDDLGNVPLSGVYDTRTAFAVRRFQERNLIPPKNIIDLETWNRLARQYNYYTNEVQ